MCVSMLTFSLEHHVTKPKLCVTYGGAHCNRLSSEGRSCDYAWRTHLPKSNQGQCWGWLQQPVREQTSMARWGGAVGKTEVAAWQDSAGSLFFPLLSGQTGWINHLQRCQHLPKQFQIGINGRWGCCSLCLISSTKCGFISYKMKPSVARRCKDQVREDGGRGWQRERGDWACALFRRKRGKQNARETGKIVRVNWGKERSTYPLKRGDT